MRIDARKKAEESFDYRVYIPKLKEFIEQECRQNEAPRSWCANIRDLINALPLRSRIRFPIRRCMGAVLASMARSLWIATGYSCLVIITCWTDERRNFDRQLKYMSRLDSYLTRRRGRRLA